MVVQVVLLGIWAAVPSVSSDSRDPLSVAGPSFWRPSTLGVSLLGGREDGNPLSVLDLPHLQAMVQEPVAAVSAGGIPGSGTFGGGAGVSVPAGRLVWTGALSFAGDPRGYAVRGTAAFARPLGTRLYGGAAVAAAGVGGNEAPGVGAALSAALGYRMGRATIHGGLLDGGYLPERITGAPLFPVFTPLVGIDVQVVDTDQVQLAVAAAVRAPSFRQLEVEAGGVLQFPWGMYVQAGVREVLGEATGALWPGFSVGWRSGSAPAVHAAVQPTRSGAGLYAGEVRIPVRAADLVPPVVRVMVVDDEGMAVPPPPRILLSAGGFRQQVTFEIHGLDDRQIGELDITLAHATEGTVRRWSFMPPAGAVIPAGSLEERLSSDLWRREITSRVVWDIFERSDVPDGLYVLEAVALDTAGNRSRAVTVPLEVNSTPPEIRAELQPVGPDGADLRDGIVISGGEDLAGAPLLEVSPEEVVRIGLTWNRAERLSVVVIDEAGREVTPLTALPEGSQGRNGSRLEVEWPGTGADRLRVPEGVYRIVAEAFDEAGNRQFLGSPPILVRSVQPRFTLSVSPMLVSPGNDTNGTVRVIPRLHPVAGLEEWSIVLRHSDGTVAAYFSGIDLPPREILLDSRHFAGDGLYTLEALSHYRNGAVARDVSGPIEVDTQAPQVELAVDQREVQPELDRSLRLFLETRGSARETRLVLRSPDETRRSVIRRWGDPPESYQWDLLDDAGALLPPGTYRLVLEAEDHAGNIGVSQERQFTLLERIEGVGIVAERSVFGPTGNQRFDTLRINLDGSALRGINGTFTVSIAAHPAGEPVRRFAGTLPLPEFLLWDGRDDNGVPAPDGGYRATISVDGGVRGVVTDSTAPFAIRTVAPAVALAASPAVISPDGDGRQDELMVHVTYDTAVESARFVLYGPEGPLDAQLPEPSEQPVAWIPRSRDGDVLPDGTYELVFEGTDAAGNTGRSERVAFAIDTRPVSGFVRVSAGAFAPREHSGGTITFTPVLPVRERLEEWVVSLEDEEGTEVVVLAEGHGDSPGAPVVWDGSDSHGRIVADRLYRAVLRARYGHGPQVLARSPAVRVDTTPPEVTVDLSPQPFSPDGDGRDDILEFRISAEDESPLAYWILEIQEPNGEFFADFGGTGAPPPQVRWDGRASNGELVVSAERYPWILEVADSLGNIQVVRGTVQVDILVEPFGDGYRIQIPSITFPPDSPTLVLTGDDEAAIQNRMVLERLTEILQRFPQYTILVEGHAVNLSGTSREEEEELLPLSRARAQAVREALLAAGIPARMVTAEGRGGTRPLVDHRDERNRWKNRRVDFILRR